MSIPAPGRSRLSTLETRSSGICAKETMRPAAMIEFIRDTIANLNGISYVVSMNPDLLRPSTNAISTADKK